MKIKWVLIGAIVAVLLILSTMIGMIMSDVKQPKYTTIGTSGNIELRQYAAIVVAEVEVVGERKEAINIGFRILADYIFGNNIAQQKIAMIAPVQQQKNEKVSMTIPGQQEKSGSVWRIRFIMPTAYSMAELPKPYNKHIILKEIPEKKLAVISFSGVSSDKNLQKYESQLQRYMKINNIQAIGTLIYAFYNPPWTLPFMRRNEIMQEIEK